MNFRKGGVQVKNKPEYIIVEDKTNSMEVYENATSKVIGNLGIIKSTLSTIELGLKYSYEKEKVKYQSKVIREKLETERIKCVQNSKVVIERINSETKVYLEKIKQETQYNKEKSKMFDRKMKVLECIII